jgi:hypothetical protein
MRQPGQSSDRGFVAEAKQRPQRNVQREHREERAPRAACPGPRRAIEIVRRGLIG